MAFFKKHTASLHNNSRRLSFNSLFRIEGICGALIAFYYLTGRWSFSRIIGDTDASFIFEPRYWFFFAAAPLLAILLYRGKLTNQKLRIDHLQFISLSCFIIYMIASMSWAPDMELAVEKGLELLLMLAALFLMAFMLSKSNAQTLFFCFWSALILLIGSFALVALLTIDLGSINRVSVLGGGGNYFGRLMGLLCFGSFFMQKHKQNIIIWIPIIALSTILLVLSGSRGALLAYIGGILTYLVLEKVQPKLIIIFIMLSIILMGLLDYTRVGQKAAETFKHRVIKRVIEEGDDSSRLFIFRAAYDMWLEHPVRGAGLAAFRASGIAAYPHNLFLESLCEGGIIGFLLLISTFLLFLVKMLNLKPHIDSASVAALVLLFVGSQISGDFYNQRGIFIFILMITYSGYYSKHNISNVKTQIVILPQGQA
jgi:O-antigen ligase